MSTITVEFIGICVHIAKKDFNRLPSEHRVVLPSNPAAKRIHGRLLEPHIPTLHFPEPRQLQTGCLTAENASTYRLRGVTLSIANATGPKPKYDQNYKSIPRLTPPGKPPLAPNDSVILDGQEPAVGYFDINTGTISLCLATINGAMGIRVTMETDGDPILQIACFDGTSTQLTFADGATLIIRNAAIDGADDEADFLLSYEVCASIPLDAVIPKKPASGLNPCAAQKLGLPADFDTACSNSGYP